MYSEYKKVIIGLCVALFTSILLSSLLVFGFDIRYTDAWSDVTHSAILSFYIYSVFGLFTISGVVLV